MQTIKTIPIIITLFIFSVFSFLVFAQDEPSAIPSFEVCDGSNCNPQVSNTRMVDEDGTSQTLFKRGTFIRIHTDIVDPGGIKYARALVKNTDGDIVTTIPLYNDGLENHGDASSYLNGSINGANDDTYSALWLAAYIFKTGVTYSLIIEACDNFEHTYYSNPYELEFSLIDAYSSNCSNIGELKCVGNSIQRCSHNDEYNINIWQSHISCVPSVCCGANPNIICCSSGQSCIAGVCVCQDIDGDGHSDSFCGGDDCDDNNPNRFPGNPEICDGIDNDCNSSVTDETVCDTDHDDYCSCSGTFVFGSNLSAVCPRTNTTNQAAIDNTCDCNDSNFSINPGAAENCVNSIDDNCNTDVDCDDSDCDTNPICHPNVCPNTVCDPGECSFCLEDCDINDCCGNGTCDPIIGENSANCLVDCPETIPPTVDTFTAVHNSGSVDIIWTVSDTGGSHLDRIEIWRAPDNSGVPGAWAEVGALRQTIASLNIDTHIGNTTDNPGDGTWWYGLHVFDQAGNTGTEPSPIQVIVFSCTPDCAIGDTDCSINIILTCGDNGDGDVCLDWVTGQDCSSTSEVCRINSSNIANCCSNLCILGTDSPRCNSISTAIETCQQQATGCGDWGITQNCSGAESCHLDSNGDPNCCADLCALSDAPRCNTGDTAVETCQAQSNGCLDWALSETCNPATEMCYGGACVDQCTPDCAIGDTDCSIDTILTCGENDSDVCLDWVSGQDCSSTSEVCRINSSNIANCCSNLCILGTDSPRCNSISTAIETCQQQATGCGDWGITQNCSGAESCHLDTGGNPNCCADLCALSDAPRCNSSDTAVETCQAQNNGCLGWGISENCVGGQMCYDGPPAYCDTIDNDPPIITLISPVASSQSWTQTSQADFETAGYNHNQTTIIGSGDEAKVTIQEEKFISVSVGNYHTLAIRTDGTLWAWGYNSNGQLGLGDTVNRNSPVQVGTETAWQAVSAGSGHTLAIRTDGTLWAWGYNGYGQLGLGDTVNRNSPVQVGTETAWQAVSAGSGHTLAIRTDGTFWAWGYNGNGQLGLGDTVNRNSPVQVGTETAWQAVFAGGNHTLAIKTDQTLWVWGYNGYGQLGLGDTVGRNSPVQVGTETAWQAVSAGGGHSLAIKTDQTLWAWGNGANYRLGLGDTVNRNSPVQVGTETAWQAVSAGGIHSLAIKTDQTLWAWGYNMQGQLGLGDIVGRNSPVQVGTETAWQAVSAGAHHTLAIKTDQTLWAWGSNSYGQLGLGNISQHIIPNIIHLSYCAIGFFTSTIYDTVGNLSYSTISWHEDIPINTNISIKVRSCDDIICSGESAFSSCSTVNNGNDISNNNCVNDGDRYIQYQAILSTTDGLATPSLDDITINFIQNPVYSVGDSFNFRFQITDASPLSSINPPRVFVQFPDGNNISTLTLYDDGAHLDGAAGDNIYGTNAWDSTGHSLGVYYVDAFAEDNKGNSVLENNIAFFNLFQNCEENITFTYKGSSVTYGIVSHNGRCWMDRNLGASQVGTAYNDSAAYGDLFQWGRLDDNHQDRSSGVTSTNSSADNPGHSNFILELNDPYDWRAPQNDNLWQGAGGINNPCPSGWRIPTEAEWGIEISSWSPHNYNGGFASPLKFTAAGFRRASSGLFGNVGDHGYCWTSTVSVTKTRALNISATSASQISAWRANGYSVRCIED